MTQRKHFQFSAKLIRDELNLSLELADQIHATEKKLIESLYQIDQERYFVRYGYKSLRGFCCDALFFTKTQSQSLVTKVRRHEPMANIGRKTEQHHSHSSHLKT